MSKRTAAEIRAYLGLRPDNDMLLHDLLRALAVAVELREMVEDLLGYAIDAGRPEVDELARILWIETAWLNTGEKAGSDG